MTYNNTPVYIENLSGANGIQRHDFDWFKAHLHLKPSVLRGKNHVHNLLWLVFELCTDLKIILLGIPQYEWQDRSGIVLLTLHIINHQNKIGELCEPYQTKSQQYQSKTEYNNGFNN